MQQTVVHGMTKNEISANKLVNENKIIIFEIFWPLVKSLGRVSNFVKIKVSEILIVYI